ncbi:hypothetical protein Asp14428_06930 [Actinoplanes sp. NBRC 14428]|nr:hypothetical protein Asp14428_06930 [Actinoplanes sp. NBRC 14428]
MLTGVAGGPPQRRGVRFGWLFAALWLFYLSENLSALLDRPADWQRGVGLAALAGFAVLYLSMLWWVGGPGLVARRSGVRCGRGRGCWVCWRWRRCRCRGRVSMR